MAAALQGFLQLRKAAALKLRGWARWPEVAVVWQQPADGLLTGGPLGRWLGGCELHQLLMGLQALEDVQPTQLIALPLQEKRPEGCEEILRLGMLGAPALQSR